MSPLSQPLNELSVTSLLNLIPLLQTSILHLVWKVANEHHKAFIYISGFRSEVDMQ